LKASRWKSTCLPAGKTAACLLLCVITATGQYSVKGRVFDSTGIYPMRSVNVYSTSGHTTSTDSSGWYTIKLSDKDSIWFSYLGKATIKYPAGYALTMDEFDISLRVSIPVLKEVKVKTRDYKIDSQQNRNDYARIFNYKKPSFNSIVTSISVIGLTIDLDELIRSFHKKGIKSRLHFQQRLIDQEHEKYIDHRFSKLLVIRLTGLRNEDLEQFMKLYRPTYEIAKQADYQFRLYILNSYRAFCAL
jgi:hypothetical protein